MLITGLPHVVVTPRQPTGMSRRHDDMLHGYGGQALLFIGHTLKIRIASHVVYHGLRHCIDVTLRRITSDEEYSRWSQTRALVIVFIETVTHDMESLRSAMATVTGHAPAHVTGRPARHEAIVEMFGAL